MPDCSLGNVYKIEPIGGDDIYIGSTTKKYLSQRMSWHRASYKLWKAGKTNKTTLFDVFNKHGIDKCNIIFKCLNVSLFNIIFSDFFYLDHIYNFVSPSSRYYHVIITLLLRYYYVIITLLSRYYHVVIDCITQYYRLITRFFYDCINPLHQRF